MKNKGRLARKHYPSQTYTRERVIIKGPSTHFKEINEQTRRMYLYATLNAHSVEQKYFRASQAVTKHEKSFKLISGRVIDRDKAFLGSVAIRKPPTQLNAPSFVLNFSFPAFNFPFLGTRSRAYFQLEYVSLPEWVFRNFIYPRRSVRFFPPCRKQTMKSFRLRLEDGQKKKVGFWIWKGAINKDIKQYATLPRQHAVSSNVRSYAKTTLSNYPHREVDRKH